MKRFLLSLSAFVLLSLPATAIACSNCPAGSEGCPMGMNDGSNAKGAAGKGQYGNFFDRADSNKDGSLSKDEFAAAKQNGWNKKKDCPLTDQ